MTGLLITIMSILSSVMILALIGFVVYRFRFYIWSGYMRARFIGEDGREITRTFRSNQTDSEFTVKINGQSQTYGKDSDRQYRTTGARIPLQFHIVNRYEPIDMLELRLQSDVAASKYNQLARNTVASALLMSFKSSVINTTTAFFLTVAVLMGGLLMMGLFINQRIEDVLKAIGS